MIGIIGINHETSTLDIRGQLSFNIDETRLFFNYLNESIKDLEAVLVSTCNRTELYFSINKSCAQGYVPKLISLLLDFRGITNISDFDFYRYLGVDAVRHLFNVASGLNSMVLGENQILGQLKQAYRNSVKFNMAHTIMNRLFHKAFEAGKKVRSETNINRGASSVSYAAVELSKKVFGSLVGHPVLLIGAGEAGELVLQSLKERGCNQITIINRTYSRAEILAKKYSASALAFNELESSLLYCDIVVTSTSADLPIIQKNLLLRIMKKRKKKNLLLIDLSVPRNIEDSVRTINNTFLFNMDDLQEVVAFNYKNRKCSIKKANVIIDTVTEDFESWLCGLNLSPTIDKLKNKLSFIMENELKNISKSISDEQLHSVQQYSDQVNKKYMGLIVKNLKNLSNNGKNVEYIDLVNNLFDLKMTQEHVDADEVKIGGEVEL